MLTGINEMSGLLCDLSAAAASGRPLSVEKVAKNSDAIMRRTQRGVAVVKRFNRFAHSADEPEAVFEPAEHIENLTALCVRLAMIKNVQIEFQDSGDNIKLEGSPFRMQHAVFACVDAGLNALASGGRIAVTLKQDDTGAVVTVSMSPIADQAPVQNLKEEIMPLANVACAIVEFTMVADSATVALRFKSSM